MSDMCEETSSERPSRHYLEHEFVVDAVGARMCETFFRAGDYDVLWCGAVRSWSCKHPIKPVVFAQRMKSSSNFRTVDEASGISSTWWWLSYRLGRLRGCWSLGLRPFPHPPILTFFALVEMLRAEVHCRAVVIKEMPHSPCAADVDVHGERLILSF